MNQENLVPDLSVILLTPDSYDTIRRTVHCIRTQSIKDRIELVIVAPSALSLNVDPSEFHDFLQHRIVELGSIRSIGSAYAAGIRAASAPVVVLGEDHSYPQKRMGRGLGLCASSTLGCGWTGGRQRKSKNRNQLGGFFDRLRSLDENYIQKSNRLFAWTQ